jgi:cobalamin biosynthesis protein CobD/CbiB
VLLIGFAIGYPALAKQGNIVPLVVSTTWGIAFGLGGLALRRGRWGVRWWLSALCIVSIVALLLAQATISLPGMLVNAVVLVLLMVSWKSLGRRT